MKKFLTLALALVMALALAAPAMAFSSTGAVELADYAIDLVLVEYEESDDYFYYGDEDVIITSLPETDRGYVTNEVVAAKVVLVVEKDASPAEDDMDLYVEGENVKFNRGAEPISGNKARKDGYTFADARYDDGDLVGWGLVLPEEAAIFEGGSKDATYEWLVFAKVADDDAKLTLVLEGDLSGGKELKVDFKKGADYADVHADFASEISYKINGDEYTIGMYGADDAALVEPADAAYDLTKGADPAALDAGDTLKAAVEGNTEGIVYKIESDAWGSDMYIVCDVNYKARVMFVSDGTTVFYIDDEGDVYEVTSAAPAADGSDMGTTLLADGATDADALKGSAKDIADNLKNVERQVPTSDVARPIERFLDEVCDALGLNPANVGNVLKPSYFGSEDAVGASQSVTVEIAPWQAFVTIPDVEVIDPPQTGDAATLMGFVMIIAALAGVVVFKKVRA